MSNLSNYRERQKLLRGQTTYEEQRRLARLAARRAIKVIQSALTDSRFDLVNVVAKLDTGLDGEVAEDGTLFGNDPARPRRITITLEATPKRF